MRSRSKSITRLIEKLIKQREVDKGWLNRSVPNYQRRLRDARRGDGRIGLDLFIDIMTALRCQVIVVPLGNKSGGWYCLNDFPDNAGYVFPMPDKVIKHERMGAGSKSDHDR